MGHVLDPLQEWLGLKGRPDTPALPDADTLRTRQQMVRQQLQAPGRDITHRRVLAAMEKVPRHEFTPENVRAEAYNDTALPIGHGQPRS